MKRIKVRRFHARNYFYERLLLEWKKSIEDRNMISTLSRANINLRSYPLEIANIAELKLIRGLSNFFSQLFKGIIYRNYRNYLLCI